MMGPMNLLGQGLPLTESADVVRVVRVVRGL